MTRRDAVGSAPALVGAVDFGFLVLAAPAIAAELDLGSAYPWLFSAGSLAYGAVVMPAEKLLAHMTASRLLAAGLALAAVGVVLLAAAGDVAAALAGRVLFGAGTGAAAAPALVLLAEEPGGGSFAWMGGAIALGFSAGILLGTSPTWRVSLLALAALAAAPAAVATRLAGRSRSRHDTAGALRLGTATAAAGASFALVRADAIAGAVALAAAAALAVSAWRAVRRRVPDGDVVVACAAGAATTMSGVGAMVLLGRRLSDTPSPADDLALALFGLGTLAAVGVARRLGRRVGPLGTAAIGLAAQALAIFAVASTVPPAPAIALFGAAHVVANAGAAAAVMRPSGATTAGLYATGQYLAAGAGPLVVLSVEANGVALAGAVAAAGAVLVVAAQRRAPTQSARRSP